MLQPQAGLRFEFRTLRIPLIHSDQPSGFVPFNFMLNDIQTEEGSLHINEI